MSPILLLILTLGTLAVKAAKSPVVKSTVSTPKTAIVTPSKATPKPISKAVVTVKANVAKPVVTPSKATPKPISKAAVTVKANVAKPKSEQLKPVVKAKLSTAIKTANVAKPKKTVIIDDKKTAEYKKAQNQEVLKTLLKKQSQLGLSVIRNL